MNADVLLFLGFVLTKGSCLGKVGMPSQSSHPHPIDLAALEACNDMTDEQRNAGASACTACPGYAWTGGTCKAPMNQFLKGSIMECKRFGYFPICGKAQTHSYRLTLDVANCSTKSTCLHLRGVLGPRWPWQPEKTGCCFGRRAL